MLPSNFGNRKARPCLSTPRINLECLQVLFLRNWHLSTARPQYHRHRSMSAVTLKLSTCTAFAAAPIRSSSRSRSHRGKIQPFSLLALCRWFAFCCRLNHKPAKARMEHNKLQRCKSFHFRQYRCNRIRSCQWVALRTSKPRTCLLSCRSHWSNATSWQCRCRPYLLPDVGRCRTSSF